MDDERLIECVRNCPCLYDKSDPDFKDADKKSLAWLEIATFLKVDENAAIKRWGNLRERFSKQIRITRSSSEKQWHLLESLEFLREHIIPRPARQSASNVESKFEANESRSTEIFEFSPSLQTRSVSTSKKKKRKSEHIDELDSDILEAVRNLQQVCTRKALREDYSAEITGFSQMICSAISNMKKKNQAQVMRRCTEIVMQAQIDELEEVQEE